MQYSQEHLKTMVYAEFGGQTECIMGNSKTENWYYSSEEENFFRDFTLKKLNDDFYLYKYI